jgi:hypothetical protein
VEWGALQGQSPGPVKRHNIKAPGVVAAAAPRDRPRVERAAMEVPEFFAFIGNALTALLIVEERIDGMIRESVPQIAFAPPVSR